MNGGVILFFCRNGLRGVAARHFGSDLKYAHALEFNRTFISEEVGFGVKFGDFVFGIGCRCNRGDDGVGRNRIAAGS